MKISNVTDQTVLQDSACGWKPGQCGLGAAGAGGDNRESALWRMTNFLRQSAYTDIATTIKNKSQEIQMRDRFKTETGKNQKCRQQQ